MGKLRYEDLLELLKTDQRKGLIQLVEAIALRRKKERLILERYHEMNELERRLRRQGFNHVAGLDEVGRGPLAGPVVTAAVILNPETPIYGLRDSKKLTKKAREELAKEIYDKALSISLHEHAPSVIDELNILQATKDSMLQAISRLSMIPDYLLLDAVELNTTIPQMSLITGDDRCLCIAAASIVAKVHRDAIMVAYHEQYPEYGFDRNVGYGSAEHVAALKKCGPTPIHRQSFIKNFLQGNQALIR